MNEKIESENLNQINVFYKNFEKFASNLNFVLISDNVFKNNEKNDLLSKTLSYINDNYLVLNNQSCKKIVNQMIEKSNILFESAKSVATIMLNMIDVVVKDINFSPFFNELSKIIDEAKKNPDSIYSWYNYYEKMSEYFWIYPYDMTTEQLHKILSSVSNEKEFDMWMSRYFSKKKIKELLSIIKKEIPVKHRRLIIQIEKAYEMNLYALANNSLILIIDDLLSFYLYDKGCTLRAEIFEPIVKKIKKKHGDIDDSCLIILMVNSFIKKLYEKIDFNNIEVESHKKTRRSLTAHGKFTSNERLDFIMLINTIYHLINVQKILKKYNKKIFRKGKKLVLPEKEEYKIMKSNVDNSILKQKNV